MGRGLQAFVCETQDERLLRDSHLKWCVVCVCLRGGLAPVKEKGRTGRLEHQAALEAAPLGCHPGNQLRLSG